MTDSIAVALVSASGPLIIAAVAVLSNTYWLRPKMASIEKRIDRIEHHVEAIGRSIKAIKL